MNGRVAHRAGLIFLRLVMERRDRRGARIRRECMALQAQEIYLRAFEQPWIRGTVRRMASYASFDFHGLVLVHERARFVAVALEAAGVLGGSSSELPVQESAMRIVAVVAPH